MLAIDLFLIACLGIILSTAGMYLLCELLTTCLLRNLKWELLGKTVLLLATIIYQAHRAVPALKVC